MPQKCSVPNCKGNYRTGPKVSVFAFPTVDSERAKWLRAIRRDDFVPSKNAKVCELHFKTHEVEWTTSMYDERNWKLLTAPLSHPRLVKGAVPSQFPNCPEYLSDTTSVHREAPDDRRCRVDNECLAKALAQSLETYEAHASTVSFKNFQEFKEKLSSISVKQDWNCIEKEQCVYFILIKDEPIPHLYCCVKVGSDLRASLFVKNVEVRRCRNLNLPMPVGSMMDIENIIDSVHSVYGGCDQFGTDSVEDSMVIFNTILDNLEKKFPLRKHMVSFLRDQIHLLHKPRVRNYSWEMLVLSSLTYSISPHCYKFIRSSGNMILPAPRTLKIVCSKLLTNPLNEQSGNFLLYMKNKFSVLSKEDKLVLLLMDEVHIKPQLDFKQDRIVGSAVNSSECATSAYVFMVNSLHSPYKDITHIVPVTNIRGEGLFKILKDVILGLEEIGFEVLCLVADNSALNRKAVSFLSDPPELKFVYAHRKDPCRKLFFAIDSVHILKCIRNKWLNAKNQELYFPNFTDHNKIETASFDSLKELHALEKNNLLKYGFTLTLKSLYPTNIERQNVQLALQIFNSPLVTAVKEIGPKKDLTNWKSSAHFIDLICRWWDVMNVRTLWKGKRLRNPLQEPITLKSSHTEFLNEMLSWLDAWKSCKSPGKFSNETHKALSLTTRCVLEMAQFCLTEKGHSFFLPGKVQNDNLEARFGKYRQLAGSQYNISLRQVFEVENKLRLQSVLDLKADVSNYIEEEVSCDVSAFSTCVAEESDVDDVQEEYWPLLNYISGYCAYSFLKRYSCNYCEVFLCNEAGHGNHSSLISANNRGGLNYPQDDVVKCSAFEFIVMNKLITNFKEEFLHHQDQKAVLILVTLKCLPLGLFSGHDCQLHPSTFIKKTLLGTASNILINNFVSDVNDKFSQKTLAQHKRRKMD